MYVLCSEITIFQYKTKKTKHENLGFQTVTKSTLASHKKHKYHSSRCAN